MAKPLRGWSSGLLCPTLTFLIIYFFEIANVSSEPLGERDTGLSTLNMTPQAIMIQTEVL